MAVFSDHPVEGCALKFDSTAAIVTCPELGAYLVSLPGHVMQFYATAAGAALNVLCVGA